MSNLQLLWFCLIGVLFSGFFFLEGFDFGVGMSVKALAHNDQERDQAVATIGPLWDGNEVWLLTAGGAMFASFPYWYASLFSGYYLILFIILVGLIIRGVSFEFRHRSMTKKMKTIWDWTLTVGSFLIPFFFGILFISLIQGMPIDDKGNLAASFTDYINPFSLVGGVALTLLCYLHGLNYLTLKTAGRLHERAKKQAANLYYVLYAGWIIFAILLFFRTDFFELHLSSTLASLIGMVILTVLAHGSVAREKEMFAFIFSGLTLILLVILLFSGLFPRVMISSLGSGYDILIKNASSSSYTLKVMSWLSLTILPFVLAYTAWSYYVFRKRIAAPEITVMEK